MVCGADRNDWYGVVTHGVGAATLGAHVLNADLREYKYSLDQGKILVMISSRFIQGTRVRQMVNAALQKIPRAITGS